ncbi:MAG: DUF3570 domain-containing protein [Burkholderiales bacterium]
MPSDRHALRTLTAAALALPGLAAPAASAQDNAAVVQFGRYQESSRDLFGVSSKYAPLSTDSLQASTWLATTDRTTATVNFHQDTWSGATPIATAPREWRGNRSRAPDTVSGASPYVVMNSPLYLDKRTLAPLRTDGFGNLVGGTDTQLVHTIAGASREIRRQVDANVRQAFDESALNLNGGVSSEPDYLSRFVGAGGQWDFNQKLTTVNAGLAYTWSDIKATLDHDLTPYIFNACGTARCNFDSSSSHIVDTGDGGKVMIGHRYDWSATAGLTQVLSRNAQMQANVAYTNSRGYLSNPYKLVEVAFVDPELQFLSPSPDALYVNVGAIFERRPDRRRQWAANLRYAQYFAASEGALHVDYAYFSDDWDIRAHTLQVEWAQPLGEGWMLTPMARYYTQSAAYFYVPYLVTNQGQYSTVTDPATGQVVTVPFDAAKLPAYYSSDYRLSAFGTLGGGFTLTKQFAKGVTGSLGYVYFQHAGSLKWGGGGEGSYADFNWWLLNASLTIDLEYASSLASGDHAAHAHHSHGEMIVPAGVTFGHMLDREGAWMVGLRAVATRQAGPFRDGTRKVDDAQLKVNGCGVEGCLTAPSWMNSSMAMLELMFAPTDWITLMVMPTYMSMEMQSRSLVTPAEQSSLPPDVQAMVAHHTGHTHESGGVGDTGLYAMFRLYESQGAHVHATLGVTAPTGDAGLRYRDTHQIDAGYQHYGMQLGSGTWDLNPSVTYLGAFGPWSWGAQASGILRLESANASGYALGNVAQGTAWMAYTSDTGMSATLRAAYTWQGTIRGAFDGTHYRLSPLDEPANYGGRFWDVGAGLVYTIRGAFAGNQLSLEWMQPVSEDGNGYQLTRRGTLNATWTYAF